jgi:NAD(P)-dependent dehydrogenase (short-subunit alcohol dehydrogenase family)
VTRQFGPPDILVNHAGIGQSTTHPGGQHGRQFRFWELDLAAWQRLQAVNSMGPFLLARLVVRGMLDKGWGRIINTATSFETMLDPFRAAYGPSKAALESSSAIWAKELEGTGVTVNCLLPGGMVASNSPGTQGVPTDKLLSAEIMGPPILWLASADSDGITGRRFLARMWRADAPTEQQNPIGWPGIGPGRTRPPAGY